MQELGGSISLKPVFYIFICLASRPDLKVCEAYSEASFPYQISFAQN